MKTPRTEKTVVKGATPEMPRTPHQQPSHAPRTSLRTQLPQPASTSLPTSLSFPHQAALPDSTKTATSTFASAPAKSSPLQPLFNHEIWYPELHIPSSLVNAVLDQDRRTIGRLRVADAVAFACGPPHERSVRQCGVPSQGGVVGRRMH